MKKTVQSVSKLNFKISVKEALESGVHFGHRKSYWNPKMASYIYGIKNNVHIIDLEKTVPMLYKALLLLKDFASKNKRILFVCTKEQASDVVAEYANKCGQSYINLRWPGGLMTNPQTLPNAVKKIRHYEELLNDENSQLNKKERLDVSRKLAKVERAFGGIRNMGGLPDVIFVIDVRNDYIAIREAKQLDIPVIGVVDTNSNPDNIDFVIPGNDDARSAVEFYMKLASNAVLEGIEEALISSGVAKQQGSAKPSKDSKDDAKSEGKKSAKDEKVVEDSASKDVKSSNVASDAKEEKVEESKTA